MIRVILKENIKHLKIKIFKSTDYRSDHLSPKHKNIVRIKENVILQVYYCRTIMN